MSEHPMPAEINFYLRGEKYGWLSNFHRAKQVCHGIEYPTNEHFYQSRKAKEDSDIARWIASAPTPFLAMCAGKSLRRKNMLDDWDKEGIRIAIMHFGLVAKFEQNEDLKQKLLATGNAILHEDSPTDMFWGKKGKDMLGKLLMTVRKEIRDREEFLATRHKNEVDKTK